MSEEELMAMMGVNTMMTKKPLPVAPGGLGKAKPVKRAKPGKGASSESEMIAEIMRQAQGGMEQMGMQQPQPEMQPEGANPIEQLVRGVIPGGGKQ